MSRHDVALRAFTHGDDAYAEGQDIHGLAPNQSDDWRGEGLIRAATPEERAPAAPPAPAPTPTPAKPRRKR